MSATIPERIRRELRPLLRDAVEISPTGEAVLSGSIEHWCFYCDGRKRLDFARRFEAAVRPERCLVFLSMATRVEKAASALASLGLPVGAIHSGMDKETRRVALERFAAGTLRYLLTSDLGARGLDIPGITHILSLDLPEEPTIYTHRAGRTGRAGARGVSIVLADAVELSRASKIRHERRFRIPLQGPRRREGPRAHERGVLLPSQGLRGATHGGQGFPYRGWRSKRRRAQAPRHPLRAPSDEAPRRGSRGRRTEDRAKASIGALARKLDPELLRAAFDAAKSESRGRVNARSGDDRHGTHTPAARRTLARRPAARRATARQRSATPRGAPPHGDRPRSERPRQDRPNDKMPGR